MNNLIDELTILKLKKMPVEMKMRLLGFMEGVEAATKIAQEGEDTSKA